jgi:hypothetical protein
MNKVQILRREAALDSARPSPAISKRYTSRAHSWCGDFATLTADISALVHKPLQISDLPSIIFFALFHRRS